MRMLIPQTAQQAQSSARTVGTHCAWRALPKLRPRQRRRITTAAACSAARACLPLRLGLCNRVGFRDQWAALLGDQIGSMLKPRQRRHNTTAVARSVARVCLPLLLGLGRGWT